MTYVQFLAWNGTLAIIGVILVSPYFIYKAISGYRFRKALEKDMKERAEISRKSWEEYSKFMREIDEIAKECEQIGLDSGNDVDNQD